MRLVKTHDDTFVTRHFTSAFLPVLSICSSLFNHRKRRTRIFHLCPRMETLLWTPPPDMHETSLRRGIRYHTYNLFSRCLVYEHALYTLVFLL